METLSIEINNPKAKQLLKNLADLKLITIKQSVSLNLLLKKLRKNADTIPTIEEITAEVEQVRSKRYASKK